MKEQLIQAKNVQSQLIEDFLEDCRLRGMTEGSVQSYHSDLRIFKRFLDSERISFEEIDKTYLKKFLRYLKEERNNSQKRIENFFTSLSTFYEYLVYEEISLTNPILPFRKRYIRSYKKNPDPQHQRKLISIEEMSMLINSTFNVRDKAIVTLLAKTGIRRRELISIDVPDINWEEQSILLKPKAKRSNRLVFFDDECARILKRWISLRNKLNVNTNALFIGKGGERFDRSGVYNIVTERAEKVGLHNSKSKRIEDHFTPHCCRHWFTTWLRRNGMPKDFIQELRGDKRRDVISIYDHIDKEELRKAYLACIPQLGI